MQRHVQVRGEGICAGLTQVRGRGSNTLKGHKGLAYRLPVSDPCLKQQPRHTMPTLYCLRWCGMGVEVSNMAGKAVYFVLLCCLSKHILAGLQRLKVALPTQNSYTKASARSLETCLVKNAAALSMHNEEEICCEGNKHYIEELKLQIIKKTGPFMPAHSQAKALE